jgi:hypothetical protein
MPVLPRIEILVAFTSVFKTVDEISVFVHNLSKIINPNLNNKI